MDINLVHLSVFHSSLNLIHKSLRMSIHKVLRLKQRRTFVSSLFGITFFATMLTVSASNILPCPARPNKNRLLDSEREGESPAGGRVIIAKRPRRWIEEKHPNIE